MFMNHSSCRDSRGGLEPFDQQGISRILYNTYNMHIHALNITIKFIRYLYIHAIDSGIHKSTISSMTNSIHTLLPNSSKNQFILIVSSFPGS